MRPPYTMVEPDYPALSRRAAALIDAAVRERPAIVLALPTGATPIGTYRELVRLRRETGTNWSQVTVFNLDEYLGVTPDHPESYAHFMRAHLFSGINVPAAQRHIPDGLASHPTAEARRYEAEIDAAGGIDLAVLGVGTNGHLGFNEPAEALVGATHVADLTDDTWRRNFPELAERQGSGSWVQGPGERPAMFRQAYTMGIGTILQAQRVLLLASGDRKREVIAEALNGPITPHNPASFLQLHRDVTLLLDKAAAG
jgi:glucosamine-6-phosphate deaminase